MQTFLVVVEIVESNDEKAWVEDVDSGRVVLITISEILEAIFLPNGNWLIEIDFKRARDLKLV